LNPYLIKLIFYYILPTMSQVATDTRRETQAELLTKLPEQNVHSLWTQMHAMVTPMPTPKAVPTVWQYQKLRPLLHEAGRTVPTEEAERRVLMLTNPALSM
jgi:gentisate 1,2-dioxygenase